MLARTLSTALALLVATPAAAAQIRFDFTGANAGSGATVAGYFGYELTTPDDNASPSSGRYETGSFHAETSLGQVFDYQATGSPTPGGLYTIVFDNSPPAASDHYDALLIFRYEAAPPHTSLVGFETSMQADPAAFTSDALPTALDLSDFDYLKQVWLPGPSGALFSYTLETLTATLIPEPATVALLCVALAALGWRRRAR
jgi:hypothetical protein